MGKIVILGGSGFIGREVCRQLREQRIDHVMPTREELPLHLFNANLKISEMVEDGDSVLMLAGLTNEHGAHYWLTHMNVTMGAQVLAGIRDRDIAHVVYLSSDSVYGPGTLSRESVITEDTELTPTTLYGLMHAMREQMFKEEVEGEKLTILRPCAVYGAGDTHNAYGINRFIKQALTSSPVEIFGDGEELRPAVTVVNLARIIVTAVMKKVSGTFNVNPGVSHSFLEMAALVQASVPGTTLLKISRTQPITHRVFNNLALRERFFQPMGIEEGIRLLVEEMKNGG